MSASTTGISLVTGATGFAGRHLVDRLLQSHDTIHAWSHSTLPQHSGSSADRVRWHSVDITDRDDVGRALATAQPSVVYHCAGLPHVAESWARAGRALRVNAYGTHVILDCAARLVTKPLVVIVSSALVYRPAAEMLSEEHPIGPADPYGVSKLAQEMCSRGMGRTILARPFNHAGPGQSSAFVTSSFARQIAEIEAGRAEPVLHVGNLDARRDITDVRDTVRAYEGLASAGRAGQAYNVCSGMAYRVGDLLEQLLAMARVPVQVHQDPERMRPSDNPLVLGNPSKIATETGWRAEMPIARTLQDLLNWWRSRVAAA